MSGFCEIKKTGMCHAREVHCFTGRSSYENGWIAYKKINNLHLEKKISFHADYNNNAGK